MEKETITVKIEDSYCIRRIKTLSEKYNLTPFEIIERLFLYIIDDEEDDDVFGW